MAVFPDAFTEMAVLLLLAAAVGALCRRLRQPLIVASIAVGILAGPSVLGWVSANDPIDLLAKFGNTLLPFVVALKLDLHIIPTMGTVAQISESSLILGHIDAETMGLMTLVGFITISASTYMIIYSHPLYQRLAPWLSVFERKRTCREIEEITTIEDGAAEFILFGLGHYGAGIAQALRERGYRVMSVDYNPEWVRTGDRMGCLVHDGDAEDPAFIASLPLDKVQMP